jgi:hypothetical protein
LHLLLLMLVQTYMDVVPFKMGLHSTAFILMLTIRNTTYIPPPVHIARRYDELYVMQYRSEGPLGQGCMSDSMMSLWNVSQTAGLGGLGSTLAPDSCPVWYTTAVFDWKWFSQVQVSPSTTIKQSCGCDSHWLCGTDACMGPLLAPASAFCRPPAYLLGLES